MQEGEQGSVALLGDAEIVEAPLARREPVRLQRLAALRQRGEKRPAAAAEEDRVARLVVGMAQVELSQRRIARQLGGPNVVMKPRCVSAQSPMCIRTTVPC